MSEAEPWRKWVAPADTLVVQAYYRVLSFVPFHAPIHEAIQAIKHIAETKRGGTIYPVIEGRVYRWDGVEVWPGIRMNLWVFGSATRKKNTVYGRVGWWTLWIFTEALEAWRTLRARASD